MDGQWQQKFGNNWNGQRPFLVLLFVLAFAVRLVAIGRYITPDELIWVYRSVQFREALLAGSWADTVVAGHPGITTVWLGALAISLQRLLQPESAAVYQWITQLAWFAPDNMAALAQLSQFVTAARLLVIAVNGLGISLISLLVGRIWSARVGIGTGLVLALDPFLLGLTGLLHVDGLLATLTAVSLFAFIGHYQSKRNGARWLLASGVAAGLALLTKTPAILLAPLLLCFILVQSWLAVAAPRARLAAASRDAIRWLAAFGATMLLLWPALWAGPARVLTTLSSNANRHIEEALRPTFFLGNVTYDHGVLFYPVALLFRLNPVVWLGLLLGSWLLLRRVRLKDLWTRTWLRRQWPVGLLLLWIVLFLVGISLAAKKFDRYMLPVLPALTVLGVWAWSRWRARWVVWATAVLLVGNWLYFAAYPLAAYNWAAGGPPAAQYVMPVGWGEGISAGARWLDAHGAAADDVAAAGIAPALAPFFPGQSRLIVADAWRQADYLIVTAGDVQTNPAATATWLQTAHLLHTIRYGGLEQAWIYQQPNPEPLPTPMPLSAPINFDRRMQVTAVSAIPRADHLTVWVEWGLLSAAARDQYSVRLSLTDDAGAVWGVLETPLVNEVIFYPTHWELGERPFISYDLPLPAGMPPAEYNLELALFTTETAAQLPLYAADGRFQGAALVQTGIPIAAAPPASVAQLQIPNPLSHTWLDGRLRLLGYEMEPRTAVNGSHVWVDLYWQAAAPLPEGVQLAFQLGNQEIVQPLSRNPSGEWPANQIIHEKYRLPIAPETPAGEVSLHMEVQGANEGLVSLDELTVTQFDRVYTLPAVEQPLAVDFAQLLHLHGYDAPAATAPGEAVALTLYWEVTELPPALLTVFVHVIDDAGNIMLQSDQWPAGLPADLWAPGQILIDTHTLQLPDSLPAGSYSLRVGVYLPSGDRLPLFAADGAPLPRDALILSQPLLVNR